MFPLTALCLLAASQVGFVSSLTLSSANQQVTVAEGSPAVLSCLYTGNPTIIWKKKSRKGTILVWNKSFFNDLKDRATISGAVITITSTVRTDNGEYICEATDGGEYADISVQLIIPVKPANVQVEVPSSATLGGTARLVCREPSAQPTPTFSWSKGTLVFPSTPPLGAANPAFTNITYSLDPTGAVLTLDPVRQSDAGDYSCTVTNQAGSAQSSVVHMAVYQVNNGAIAAAIIIPLLILAIVGIGLYFAYRQGYLPIGKNKKKTTVQKVPAAEYLSVEDEGDFRHKPSFDL